MEFGSQEFFERLKAGVAAGDPDVYVDLNNTVEHAVKNLVRSKVKFSDVDDVIQEIQLSVWQRVTTFLITSENNAPSQRNAWLIKVAKSRIIDFINHNYRDRPDQFGDDEPTGGKPRPTGPVPPTLADAEQMADYERCCRAISHICSLDMAPERILACLYNAFLIPAASSGDARKKGDPEAIVRRFSGRPLSELRDALWQELSWLFIIPPPNDLLAPLDKKLENGAADKPFQLTKREITIVSNRGRKSAQKKHDDIVGGTLDE